MMRSMSLQTRLTVVPEPVPQRSLAGQFRDRIALRSRRADVEFPKALDLEARALEALHGALHGVASSLSGTDSPDVFRERLRGERSLPVAHVCRLATDPRREAKAATVALLDVIAQAIGYSIAPMSEERASLVDQVIAANEAAVTAHGLVTKAVADGVVGADEAGVIKKAATELRRLAGGLESIALAAWSAACVRGER